MVRVVHNINEANCVTHSGTMHADEVFATAFLELYLKDVSVYRTKSVDSTNISDDILVYDIGRGKYDHHQEDALKRDKGITYSSFGLLFKEFGKDFLSKQNNIKYIDEVFNGIDKDLVEGIDADDNGFFPKIEANYKVKTVSNIIKMFNPSYDSFEDESTQFIKAVSLAKEILLEEVIYINGKVLSDKEVSKILDKMEDNSKYLILEEYLPYEDSVLSSTKTDSLLFVAFPSNRGGFAIKVLPKSSTDRTARLPFPEEWAGKEGEELERISGISGLNFCHTGRFIVNCRDMSCVLQVLNLLCK
ncbi:MAG: MYG1 family protein [Bacilli bacterium]|nr:MYG1 family protein [Bacilli bacterium]